MQSRKTEVFALGGERGERKRGARWDIVKLREKRELFVNEKTPFAQESHGLFEKRRGSGGE